MCKNKRRHVRHFFLWVAAPFLLWFAPLRAQTVTVLNSYWAGNDYVLILSDSVSYTVDPAASDSMLLLRFSRPLDIAEAEAPGPNGISAALSRNGGDSTMILTVRGKERVGYSTLWRPYSHRLIVHTFNWDSLEYAAEQYHKGLLALEQGLPDQAKSYLSSAIAFDNGNTARKAASVLGVMYTNEGKDSLAAIYLRAPLDADDYMARSVIDRQAGDTAAAGTDAELFREKMEALTGVESEHPLEPREPRSVQAKRPPIAKIFNDWRGVVIVGIAAFLIILLAVWFSKRPVPPTESESADAPHGQHPAPGSAQPGRTSSPVGSGGITPVAPESAPDPVKSSLHAPEIALPSERNSTARPEPVPSSPEESSETAEENIRLPQPDALPNQADEAEISSLAEEEKTIAEPVRRSGQAEELRQRMEAAQSIAAERRTSTAMHSEPESTVTEARRLNVSRDYVELRNRIAELRRKIEKS